MPGKRAFPLGACGLGPGAAAFGSSVRARRTGSSVMGHLGRSMSVQPAWPGSARDSRCGRRSVRHGRLAHTGPFAGSRMMV